MDPDFQLLTTIASGAAFLLVSFFSFFAKYRSDKKDDTVEVEEKIEKVLNLDGVVRTLAVQLSEVSDEVSELRSENKNLKINNEDLQKNVKGLSKIVAVKYPMALDVIRVYRDEHPATVVEIPSIIMNDLGFS